MGPFVSLAPEHQLADMHECTRKRYVEWIKHTQIHTLLHSINKLASTYQPRRVRNWMFVSLRLKRRSRVELTCATQEQEHRRVQQLGWVSVSETSIWMCGCLLRTSILQPQSHFLNVPWQDVSVNCCYQPKLMVFPKWDLLRFNVFKTVD